MNRQIKRGDIFNADLGIANTRGSEQKGYRPVLVIQNDVGNKYSPTVIVACITTKDKNKLPTHMGVDVYEPSTIMLEQIRTICKSRLEEYVCTISEEQVVELNSRLMISLGIIEI